MSYPSKRESKLQTQILRQEEVRACKGHNMSIKKPTVYLLCGLPAAGKTTLAKQLEEKQGAVRFTLDEWMIRLYDYTIFDREYGEH